jgi:hypothetical protein
MREQKITKDNTSETSMRENKITKDNNRQQRQQSKENKGNMREYEIT